MRSGLTNIPVLSGLRSNDSLPYQKETSFSLTLRGSAQSCFAQHKGWVNECVMLVYVEKRVVVVAVERQGHQLWSARNECCFGCLTKAEMNWLQSFFPGIWLAGLWIGCPGWLGLAWLAASLSRRSELIRLFFGRRGSFNKCLALRLTEWD